MKNGKESCRIRFACYKRRGKSGTKDNYKIAERKGRSKHLLLSPKFVYGKIHIATDDAIRKGPDPENE
jgi:hypothetical protein